jgi:hypothetical protein
MSRTARHLVFPLFGLALAGCAEFNEQAWPWQQRPDRPAAATRPAVTEPAPRLAKPVEPPPPRPAQPAKPKAPQAETSALVEKAAPPRLVGMSEEETAAALGRPMDEVEQPPGKVWTYQADGCRLAVHLFPDMDKGGFYALDYTAGEAPKDWCLGRVAQEARKRG